MARDRDLKIAVVAEAKSDLEPLADDLDSVGRAAQEAGREVERGIDQMSAGADRAERALKDLAGESDDTRRKLGAFFDRVGREAKEAGRDVDEGMDRARKGLDTFKDEANQSGRETAASFGGGFEDVVDFVQETAANAFADMGKVGAGAGIAIAAGLGFAVSKVVEFNEKMSELRQLFFDLGKENATPGLTSLQANLKKITDEISPDDVKDIGDALKQTGVNAESFFKALAQDPKALAQTRRELEGLIPAINAPWDQTANEAQHLLNILGNYEDAARDGAEGSGLLKGVLSDTGVAAAEAAAQAESATTKVDALGESMKTAADVKHVENLAGIAEGLRGVADASDEISEAVGKEGQVSIGTLTKLLNEQTEAAKKHQANVAQALRDGGEEFASWVAQQGPEVSRAYAKGSSAEKAALRKAFQSNVGQAMGQGVSAGLLETKGSVSDSAGQVFKVVENKLTGETIYIPTGIQPPSQSSMNRVAAQIKQGIGAIYVETVVRDPRGGRRID